MTPLYVAVWEAKNQIVEILLEKGNSNVDFQDKVFFIVLLW